MIESTFTYKEIIQEPNDNIDAIMLRDAQLKEAGYQFHSWSSKLPHEFNQLPVGCVKFTYFKSES